MVCKKLTPLVIRVTDLGNLGATETLDNANGPLQKGTLDDDTAITLPAVAASATGWELELNLFQNAAGFNYPTIDGVDISEFINPLPYSKSVFNIRAGNGDAAISPKYTEHDCPVFLDFINDAYYINGIKQARHAAFKVQRNTDATYVDSGVALTNFSSNILRVGSLGALIEPNRTNVVLYNRDLTNAAWTKSNVTAAKDQTGIDGVASSASKITATAGNGTCLQAITLASSARFQSVYVKRVTGSGTINMTMDNGSTWTAITVTGSWTRVTIPTQTLANPTVGFRIVTSGDAIAIDYVQNENGTYATSPLSTTSTSTNRNADVITLADFSAVPLTAATIVAIGTSNAVSESGVAHCIFGLDNETSNERIQIRQVTTTGSYIVVDGGAQQANIAATGISYATRNKFIASFTANQFKFRTNASSGTTDTAGTLPTPTRAVLGESTGATNWNGFIEKIMIFNRVLTDAEFTEMAAL